MLDSQKALFSQQLQLVNNRSAAARSLVALYKALGGGWENGPRQLISESTRKAMSGRGNWGELPDTTDRLKHTDGSVPARKSH